MEWRGGNYSSLIGMLALAVAIEFAILRVLTRTAIHIPALDTVQGPYKAVAAGGEYAYFVAVALIGPAMAIAVARLFQRRAPVRYLAAFGIVLFAVPSVLAWFGSEDLLVLDAGTMAGVVALCGAATLLERRRLATVPVLCFAVAFTLSGAYTAIPALAAHGGAISQPGWLLNGAELFGLAFALSTPLLIPNAVDRVSRWASLTVGAVVLLAFLGNGSTTRFLLLWNAGLSGIVPGLGYAAAAAALTLAGVSLYRQEFRLASAGLLLIVAGGIGLHSTYQSSLVIAGLAALLVSAAEAREVQEVPEP